ncbi:hypothetical protein DVH03_01140 [Lactiplantibacillus plantarum]|nr:hypothetical protein BL295_12245 [Lactiplantibacillus plantarum]MCT3246973.1 hypothetical protein [Lactiplantibacillus plantarum]QBX93031.1 hypothetical protein DVH03_01140 [Lactiplantibacillus plantarum]
MWIEYSKKYVTDYKKGLSRNFNNFEIDLFSLIQLIKANFCNSHAILNWVDANSIISHQLITPAASQFLYHVNSPSLTN